MTTVTQWGMCVKFRRDGRLVLLGTGRVVPFAREIRTRRSLEPGLVVREVRGSHGRGTP
jgi:hypothetical protein